VVLKFRVIQSNDRGLVTQQGDRTYARRGPAKGEESLELPTLFIWVSRKDRYLARCWTRWTGERLGDDFIYVVSRFRDLIDLQGDTRYHQWCSKQLRSDLWTLERVALDLSAVSCPPPEAVYDGDRHKSATYLQRRKQRLREQTPELSTEEEELIQKIYHQRDSLNQEVGFIQYHVDHIIPLAKGGCHHPDNLQVIRASDNVRKGAKVPAPIEQAGDSQRLLPKAH
jgi:5-methylcytosine-specific restriction endonuclease McrA